MDRNEVPPSALASSQFSTLAPLRPRRGDRARSLQASQRRLEMQAEAVRLFGPRRVAGRRIRQALERVERLEPERIDLVDAGRARAQLPETAAHPLLGLRIVPS